MATGPDDERSWSTRHAIAFIVGSSEAHEHLGDKVIMSCGPASRSRCREGDRRLAIRGAMPMATEQSQAPSAPTIGSPRNLVVIWGWFSVQRSARLDWRVSLAWLA
jgi:hypothetical protein